MRVKFTKMQGIGNDMIVIDNRDEAVSLSAREVAAMCDRRFGIGADGLILVEAADSRSARDPLKLTATARGLKAENCDCAQSEGFSLRSQRLEIDCDCAQSDCDFFMNYYNADGSVGEMCGNGIRCAAKFFEKVAGFDGKLMRVGTRAGVKEIKIDGEMCIVNMGAVETQSSMEIEGVKMNCVSVGNPHAVALVADVEEFDLERIGPLVGVNFEIFQLLEGGALKMRVWERGSGMTLACGTGACAVYYVAKKMGLVSGEDFIEVILPGGSLWIREIEAGVLMKGGAEFVFEGEMAR